MPDPSHHLGSRIAYQLERLYWQATGCAHCGDAWRQEFGRLETEIRERLSEAERARLLRTSRSYQLLRQVA